jgi:hypothetical protein
MCGPYDFLALVLTQVSARPACHRILNIIGRRMMRLTPYSYRPSLELHIASEHLTMFPGFPGLFLCSSCN